MAPEPALNGLYRAPGEAPGDAPGDLGGAQEAPCGYRAAVRVISLREGEPCGDAALHLPVGATGCLLAIIDGLGHGAPAALAAQAAMGVIETRAQQPLPALFEQLDTDLASTRGAAIGLARIDGLRLRYAGLGNTRAVRWRGENWLRLSSQYGIVGGGMPERLDVTDIDLLPGDWLLFSTDGLDEMLHLPMRLPEWERDPGLLCEHLMAHWRNVRDDAGVLALHVGAA